METFAAIIPTHSISRKIFVEWQKQRAHDMGYDKVIIVDYEPESTDFDLMQRLECGVEQAHGFDWCSVIEDDDYYALNYLDTVKSRITANIDFVGINQTVYYHLFSTGYKQMTHPGRSSMFCTSFRTDSFYDLPEITTTPYIDIEWWKHIVKGSRYKLLDNNIAVGIKHGNVFGKSGGNGHFMSYSKFDLNLNYLKARTDDEAFKFYRQLKATFQKNWELNQTNK